MSHKNEFKAYAAVRRYAWRDGTTFEGIDATTIRYSKNLVEMEIEKTSPFDIENPVIGIEEITLIRKGTAE